MLADTPVEQIPRRRRRRTIVGWPSLENGYAAKGWDLAMFAAQIKRKTRAVEAWLYGEQKPTSAMFLEIGELINIEPGVLMADCPKLLKEAAHKGAVATDR